MKEHWRKMTKHAPPVMTDVQRRSGEKCRFGELSHNCFFKDATTSTSPTPFDSENPYPPWRNVVRRTKLYDFHLAKKGKLVPFADHWLPVQFPNGRLERALLHPPEVRPLRRVTHGDKCASSAKIARSLSSFATVADVQGLAPRTGRLSFDSQRERRRLLMTAWSTASKTTFTL